MNSNGNGRHAQQGNGSAQPTPSAPRIKTASTPLTTLYERRGADGFRYLVGRIGSARIIILQTDAKSHGCRIWEAVVSPGPNLHPAAEDLAQRIDDGGVTFLEVATASAR